MFNIYRAGDWTILNAEPYDDLGEAILACMCYSGSERLIIKGKGYETISVRNGLPSRVIKPFDIDTNLKHSPIVNLVRERQKS